MSSLTNGLPSAPGVAVTGDLEKSRNRLATTNQVQTPGEKQMRKRSNANIKAFDEAVNKNDAAAVAAIFCSNIRPNDK
jgi:hypothetical protein